MVKQYIAPKTYGPKGEDWMSTYSYNTIINDILERIVYVECDYVK